MNMKKFFKTIYGQITLLMTFILIFFLSISSLIYRQNAGIRDNFGRSITLSWLNFNIANHQGDFLQVFKALDGGILHMNTGLSTEAVNRVEDILGKADHFSWIKPIDSTLTSYFTEANVPDSEKTIGKLKAIWEDLYIMTQDVHQVVSFSSDSTRDTDRFKAMAVYNQKVSDINGRFFSHLWGESFHGDINQRLNRIISDIQFATGSAMKEIIIYTAGFSAIIIIFWLYFRKKFKASFQKPLDIIRRLGRGEIVEAEEAPENELGPVIEASNQLGAALQKASQFAQEIGQGNFNFDYQALSEKDMLGNALMGMKDDLWQYKEREKRQNWSNEGYTKFSDILRNSFLNIDEMGRVIVGELAKYLHANLAGLFLYNEETQNLDLKACYAYGRQKFLQRSIMPGEGLVGQCWLENQTSFYKEIPENYIAIKSGLGQATPRCLLIVPLKNEEKTEGILEIASFNEFQDYEIEFVEKVAQNIASVTTTINRNSITETLLNESQIKTETLNAQEEELKNSVEELNAIQEELRRRESEYEVVIAMLKAEVEELKTAKT